MLLSIIILSSIGFCISLYSYITEKKIKQDPTFKPVCDISDRISCTRVMKSSYANIFFFSNALVSMLFYLLVAIFALCDAHSLLLGATTIGCLVSCILAYLLYVKIQAVCLLCTSLYVINFILLYLSWGH